MTIILAAIAAIGGVGWLVNAVSLHAIILYIIEKGYPIPSDEETKRYIKRAARFVILKKL